jgi:hypothetical protein
MMCFELLLYHFSRGSSVDIVTRLCAGRPTSRGLIPGRIKSFSLFSVTFTLNMEPTQSPKQSVPGAVSSGFNWMGRETNHSHLSIAEVKVKNGVTTIYNYVYLHSPVLLYNVVLN